MRSRLQTAGAGAHHQDVTAPEGVAPVTLPRESGRPAGPAIPSGPPFTRSTSTARTRATSHPIRSFFFLRGCRIIGALGPPRAAGLGTKAAGTPPSLCVPAGRPGPARARPPGDPRLDRRCRGSPGRLGVRGRLAAAASVTGPRPPGHWHHAGRWQISRSLEVDRSRPPPPGALARFRRVTTTW